MDQPGDRTEPQRPPLSAVEAWLEERLRTTAPAPGRRNGITPRAANAPAPLSFSQLGLWFLQHLDPQTSAYNRPVAFRLTGPLDAAVLERALNEIVRRHEVLRATYPMAAEGPRQTILPELHIPILLTDLTHLAPGEREKRVEELARREARKPFDLEAGPVPRAILLKLGEEEHHLVIAFHHIAFDGWSAEVLLGELAALYEAYAAGAVSPLPELPVQYADYAIWQRERQQEEAIERQLAYWRERLANISTLDLPTDRPRPTDRTFNGGHQLFRLSPELNERVKALGRQEQATLFMVLLAAYVVLLKRLSGQDDIVVGCPSAGRGRSETERLIGCFINVIAVRTDLSGAHSFRDVLGRVRETSLGAFAHQEVPFEKVVEDLQPERNWSRPPLVQALFQLRNYPKHEEQAGSLNFEARRVESGIASYDLTVELDEDAAGLVGRAIYNADLFDPGTIRHLLEQYAAVIEQAIAAPDAPISDYSLLTESSRSVVPDPRLPIDEPFYEPIVETFDAWAARSPEHVAIRQGTREWSYDELATHVDRLARSLVALGLERGEVVAIAGPRSFGVVAGMLGVLAGGGVILPLDPALPEERKQVMLQEAGASVLLYVGEQRPEDAWVNHLDDVRLVRVDEHPGAEAVEGKPEEAEVAALPQLAPEDAAYIFFTSGTTGRPKGVLGTHKGLSHFLTWQRETFAVGPGDRCAHLTALSFDVVLRDVFLPLSSGATLCIPPEGLSPDRVLSWASSAAVSLLHTVPSLSRLWLDYSQGVSIPSLRWVLSAGEPLTGTLVNRWREVAPEAEVVNLYGPTETTMVKCFYRVPKEALPGVQPAGRPLPQAQALVLSETGRVCGVNERGEIVIRTPFRTRGYLNRPEENRARFVPNPFRNAPDDVLYRTGDLGRYRADGNLVVLGRLDHQIKVNGVRIEPGEVSAVLAQHEGVQACTVVGKKNEEGAGLLVAYVVTRDERVGSDDLRAYLSRRLPAAMVPATFVFVEHMPLLPNGKVDHKALPAPEITRRVGGYLAPRTPEEQTLAEIWSEVLGVERVGVNDSFFDLGGHSLLIFRASARMSERMGVRVPVHAFFESPTVAQMAMVVSTQGADLPGAQAADLNQLFSEIEGLSDEEVAKLLGEAKS